MAPIGIVMVILIPYVSCWLDRALEFLGRRSVD
jgi:hypothetical protein